MSTLNLQTLSTDVASQTQVLNKYKSYLQSKGVSGADIIKKVSAFMSGKKDQTIDGQKTFSSIVYGEEPSSIDNSLATTSWVKTFIEEQRDDILWKKVKPVPVSISGYKTEYGYDLARPLTVVVDIADYVNSLTVNLGSTHTAKASLGWVQEDGSLYFPDGVGGSTGSTASFIPNKVSDTKVSLEVSPHNHVPHRQAYFDKGQINRINAGNKFYIKIECYYYSSGITRFVSTITIGPFVASNRLFTALSHSFYMNGYGSKSTEGYVAEAYINESNDGIVVRFLSDANRTSWGLADDKCYFEIPFYKNINLTIESVTYAYIGGNVCRECTAKEIFIIANMFCNSNNNLIMLDPTTRQDYLDFIEDQDTDIYSAWFTSFRKSSANGVYAANSGTYNFYGKPSSGTSSTCIKNSGYGSQTLVWDGTKDTLYGFYSYNANTGGGKHLPIISRTEMTQSELERYGDTIVTEALS